MVDIQNIFLITAKILELLSSSAVSGEKDRLFHSGQLHGYREKKAVEVNFDRANVLTSRCKSSMTLYA
jgi:hypothetical protein